MALGKLRCRLSVAVVSRLLKLPGRGAADTNDSRYLTDGAVQLHMTADHNEPTSLCATAMVPASNVASFFELL